MKVALIGNQNCGKTTLFNALTGMNAKIGNWPGVTVEKRSGMIKNTDIEIVDLPGVYSLSSYSIEEEISRKFIVEEKPDVIVNLIDSTSLERSLYLTTQLLELDIKIIVVLNMLDILKKKGGNIYCDKLEKELGVKVLEVSALNKFGIDNLIEEIQCSTMQNYRKNIFKGYDSDCEEVIATKRYKFIENVKKNVFKQSIKRESVSDKLDKIFLNKWLAFPLFAIIMFLIFYFSVGVVGNASANFVEEIITFLKNNAEIFFESIEMPKMLISLIVDGVINGVGTVIGFIPQLIILFLCIAILETTGYMSRVALIFDKLFRIVGLSGKSIIPFVLGLGCSVPGIMGTRIIENGTERETTAVLTPFIPCSAKLPSIILISNYFFEQNSVIIVASVYLLAMIMIIVSALIIKIFVCKNNINIYIAELPEYKKPNLNYILKDVFEKTSSFVKRAGSVILISSIVIWCLISFSFDLQYVSNIEESMLAVIGNKISCVFEPMIGMRSWEVTVSVLQGLIAKEQVVSSMSVIAGKVGKDIFESNSVFGFFTPLSAYSFLVFNLFSAPCIGAIAAMKKELGGIKKMLKAITFQSVFAWILATGIYQIGSKIETGILNVADLVASIGVALVMTIFLMKNNKSKKCVICPCCERK